MNICTLPIFIQIAESIKERIISDFYQEDNRIPSTRELAVEMQVNPNTIVKAFDELQRCDIIYNKRGLGYFVSPGAKMKIIKERRDRVMLELMPSLFREMSLLGITYEELEEAYHLFTKRKGGLNPQ